MHTLYSLALTKCLKSLKAKWIWCKWQKKYDKTDPHLLSLGPDPLISLRDPRLMRPLEPEVGLGQGLVLVLGLLQVDPTVFQTGSLREWMQFRGKTGEVPSNKILMSSMLQTPHTHSVLFTSLSLGARRHVVNNEKSIVFLCFLCFNLFRVYHRVFCPS